MSRFVVLLHTCPPGSPRPTHFDLMLDVGAALRTWALDRWPPRPDPIAALELADHRRDYLDYEGEVSGGRGHVRRVEAGPYELLSEEPDALVLRLVGEQTAWRGTVQLRRVRSTEHDAQRWELSVLSG